MNNIIRKIVRRLRIRRLKKELERLCEDLRGSRYDTVAYRLGLEREIRQVENKIHQLQGVAT